MIHSKRWLLLTTLFVGWSWLSSGYAAPHGEYQTFLSLILEKPDPIPTTPLLAIFSTFNTGTSFEYNLYATTPDGTVSLLSRNTGNSYRFSPDGRYLAANRLYGLHDQGHELFDLVEGTHRRLIPSAGSDFEWAPDNQHYAFSGSFGSNYMLYASDINSNSAQELSSYAFPFQWLRNSQYLVIRQNVKGVYGLYRLAADGSERIPIQVSANDVGAFAVLPDDRIVYVQRGLPGDDLFVINNDGTEQVRLTNDPTTYKTDFFVSPRQGLITYRIYGQANAPNGDTAVFFVLNASGEVVSTIQNRCRPTDPCDIVSLVWTPDESAIYYTIQNAASSEADLFRTSVTMAPIPQLIRAGITPRGNLGLSPDGRYLAYDAAFSTLIIRDITTGDETTIPTHGELVFQGWRPFP